MKNRIQVAAACCALLVAMPGVAMVSPERVRQALEEQAKWDKLGKDIQKVIFGGKALKATLPSQQTLVAESKQPEVIAGENARDPKKLAELQHKTHERFKGIDEKLMRQFYKQHIDLAAPLSLKNKVSGICLTSGKLLALFSAGALMEYGLHKGGISHPYLGLMLGGSLLACLGVYEAVKAYKQGTANNHKTLRQ